MLPVKSAIGGSNTSPMQLLAIEDKRGITNVHARWKRPGARHPGLAAGIARVTSQAINRRDFVVAEELRAEIAEAMALLDRAYDAGSAAV